MDIPKYDVVLGMTWLAKYDPIPTFSTGQLKLSNGQSIYPINYNPTHPVLNFTDFKAYAQNTPTYICFIKDKNSTLNNIEKSHTQTPEEQEFLDELV